MAEYWEIMREIREDHKLTQTQIAEYLGTTQQQYSAYERGLVEFPLRHAFALRKLYHLTLDELFGLKKDW